MAFKHYIEGVQVGAPLNNLEIEVIYENDVLAFNPNPDNEPELSINVGSLVFAGQEAVSIRSHFEDPTRGAFLKMYYRMTTETDLTVFDGYFDFKKTYIDKRDEIEVGITRNRGKDEFQLKALSTAFDDFSDQIVTVEQNFIIEPVIRPLEVFMIGFSLYAMSKEFIEAILRLAKIGAQTVDTVTPDVTVPIPSVVVKIGQIIKLVLLIIADVIYTVALFIAILQLANQLIDIVFPQLMRYKVATLKELLTKGCAQIGLGFQSTIIDELEAYKIVPVPILADKESFFDQLFNSITTDISRGFPGSQDTVVTLSDLFFECKKMFNAKIKVINGNVVLERRDNFTQFSNVQLQDNFNDQERRVRSLEYNTQENSNEYLISFAVDAEEKRTGDNFRGTNYQVDFSVNDVDRSNLTGFPQFRINLALGTRKSGLNFLETTARDVAIVIDSVLNTNLTSNIDARIGALTVSDPIFSTTKIIYAPADSIPENHRDKLSAKFLWENYHFINSFPVVNNRHNQKTILRDVPFTLNGDDFVTLTESGVFTTGEEIESMVYNDNTKIASITYWQLEVYDQRTVINGFTEG